jgi:competence protein ComEC
MPSLIRLLQAIERSLRFRPLLWLAMAGLFGVACGGWWAQKISGNQLATLTRDDWRLIAFWPLVPLAFWLAWLSSTKATNVERSLNSRQHVWRVCVFVAVAALFSGFTARRLVPVAGDISALAQPTKRASGPIEAPVLTVRGVVASAPRRGEFQTQFALECQSPRRGRIWVSVPATLQIRAGDELATTLELRPLPEPTNPGQRAAFWHLVGQSCWSEGRRAKDLVILRAGQSNPLARRVDEWRTAILMRYERAFRGDDTAQSLARRPFPGAMASLTTAMVFGEGGLNAPLPRQLRDDFQAAGLSHVLVASGTQVAAISVLLLVLARVGRLRGASLVLIVVPGVLLYALVAGGAPSIWRASAAAILVVLALVCGRQRDGLSLWGAAMGTLLLVDPALAWSLSFQLTFAATWGLLCLTPVIERALKPFGRGPLLKLAAFSLGAQAATIPLSLGHFGTWSAIGVSVNLLAVPIASVMVLTGALGLILPLEALNYWLARLLAAIAHGAASLPGARLQGTPFRIEGMAACYACFVLATLGQIPQWSGAARELARTLSTRARQFLGSLRPIPLAGVLGICGFLLTWWRVGTPPPQNAASGDARCRAGRIAGFDFSARPRGSRRRRFARRTLRCRRVGNRARVAFAGNRTARRGFSHQFQSRTLQRVACGFSRSSRRAFRRRSGRGVFTTARRT